MTAAHRLAVLALYGVAAVGTFVVPTLIGVAVDEPARALARYAASFGAIGLVVGMAAIVGLPAFAARWPWVRDQRRQIMRTGIIDVPQQRDTRPPRGVVRWVMAPLWIAVAILFVVCVVVAIRDLA